ncbi:hypothetical protein OQE50_13410 [Enterobacter kobei]|uniref:hypothetical protein n=1 Tax=Enterobacter kobei TaxID=208224 RepID=UPI00224A75A5|nr:hypothetical protein [Enterobacter kobei]UZQ65971.1 hypothetical protein OQE50_13410 [Enterobacter kobei]
MSGKNIVVIEGWYIQPSFSLIINSYQFVNCIYLSGEINYRSQKLISNYAKSAQVMHCEQEKI